MHLYEICCCYGIWTNKRTNWHSIIAIISSYSNLEFLNWFASTLPFQIYRMCVKLSAVLIFFVFFFLCLFNVCTYNLVKSECEYVCVSRWDKSRQCLLLYDFYMHAGMTYAQCAKTFKENEAREIKKVLARAKNKLLKPFIKRKQVCMWVCMCAQDVVFMQ